MSLTDYPTQISLTSKDYESLRDEILSKIPIITGGKWTNLNSSDPGIAILELLASMVDNIYFYQDSISTELYIPSANQRLSLMKLLRVFGYEIPVVRSARGNVSVAVSKTETETILFPVAIDLIDNVQFAAKTALGTTIYTMLTPEEVSGVATATYRITSLTEKVNVPVIQGVRVDSSKTTFTSDGTQNQRFVIDESNVDISQMLLKVNNIIWTKVPTFFNTTRTSTVYKVEYDDQFRPVLVFGDNQFGMIPLYGQTITVKAYQSVGSYGIVGAGAVDSVLTTISDSSGQKSVTLSAANANAIVGGADIEPLESAKENAIGNLITNDRLVTTEDYKLILGGVPGIDKVNVWGEQESNYPDYNMMNRIQVAFYSSTSWDFNNISHVNQYNSLLDLLSKTIDLKIPITTRYSFMKPRLVDIYLSLQLGLDTRNYDPQILVSQVRTAIKSFFDISNVDFGQAIHVSDINQICNVIPGVLWSQVTRLHTLPVPNTILDAGPPQILYPDPAPMPPTDLYLGPNEIPTLTSNEYVVNPPMVAPPTPYIKITNFPSVYNMLVKNVSSVPELVSIGKVGTFNLKVINPDGQQDVLPNKVTIIPDTTAEHISIMYVDASRGQQRATRAAVSTGIVQDPPVTTPPINCLPGYHPVYSGTGYNCVPDNIIQPYPYSKV